MMRAVILIALLAVLCDARLSVLRTRAYTRPTAPKVVSFTSSISMNEAAVTAVTGAFKEAFAAAYCNDLVNTVYGNGVTLQQTNNVTSGCPAGRSWCLVRVTTQDPPCPCWVSDISRTNRRYLAVRAVGISVAFDVETVSDSAGGEITVEALSAAVEAAPSASSQSTAAMDSVFDILVEEGAITERPTVTFGTVETEEEESTTGSVGAIVVEKKEKDGLPGGAIAGIIIAVLVVIGVVCAVVYFVAMKPAAPNQSGKPKTAAAGAPKKKAAAAESEDDVGDSEDPEESEEAEEGSEEASGSGSGSE